MPPLPPARVTVCLPTYNEAENLPVIAEAILRFLPEARLLVIDDASPDGTGAVADHLAAADGRISVLHRPGKQGLGRAYEAGFRATLAADPRPEAIAQMDADLSHPAARLPALLAALAESDLAIGSRYVPGGGIERWSWPRKLLSRLGSTYARACLGLPVRDLTGGFKMWRSDLLEKVIASPLAAAGYAFQIETTWRAHRAGARIAEIPILFADRGGGRSKMTWRIAAEAVFAVPRLRWRG